MQRLSTLLLFLAISLNFAQAQTQSIIVVNGGIFGTTNYANVTIEDLQNSVLQTIGTIQETSIQDVLVDSQYVYVAAQDSIVKYNWITRTRVAAAAFGAPSTVKLGLHNGRLLVGNWYAPFGFSGTYTNHFRMFDANTLTFIDSIPEITKAADDFVIVGDYAYIAQNNTTSSFADTLGYLAVVDLTTYTFVRYDTLNTMGYEIGRLAVEGNMIYALNKASNTISSYNTATQAKATQTTTIDIKTATYGPTLFTTGSGVWYFPYDNGIGSYNLATNTVINADILTIAGGFSYVMDTDSTKFYVSRINFSDQTMNSGRIYDMNGDSIGQYQVGFSPEAMALVSNTVIGSTTTLAKGEELAYQLYPNPTSTQLTVALEEASVGNIQIFNQVGQVIYQQAYEGNQIELNVSHLTAGAYWIAVQNSANKVRIEAFVKQ